MKNFKSFLKQARKGFRPPYAMKVIGYFQNLRNLLRNYLQIFGEFLGNLLEKFFGRKIFGWIFMGGFFGRNSLGGIT